VSCSVSHWIGRKIATFLAIPCHKHLIWRVRLLCTTVEFYSGARSFPWLTFGIAQWIVINLDPNLRFPSWWWMQIVVIDPNFTTKVCLYIIFQIHWALRTIFNWPLWSIYYIDSATRFMHLKPPIFVLYGEIVTLSINMISVCQILALWHSWIWTNRYCSTVCYLAQGAIKLLFYLNRDW
jgi:hypothetical protein